MQDYIFGDLLKMLRKAKRLSQQALADRLGVHRNTIWSWEQGFYLPDSRGMVLELARQLGLDEPETRQLLEASLTTVSSHWNVPFARNPFFTGREQVLEQLQAALSQQAGSAALTQSYALYGLGGIGKTQVAVEYAYQHRHEYEAILWVEAETPVTLVSSFVALADLLALSERVEERDQSKIVTAVLRWLNRHQGWLLIFDNVEDLALLKPFLPASGQGAILLTTRLHTLGTLAQTIELSPMSMNEGANFLLARAMRPPVNEAYDFVDPYELTAARELVAAMGGLPLALDQAGAYIDATQCSLSDYLHLFQSSQYRLLDEHDAASDHPLSVSKTFALAFERIEHQNPAAAELLTICAFLAPDAIPESLFLEGTAQLGPTFEALVADPLVFQDALKTLLTYSLLQRDPATHTLTIHRLVQVVLQSQMDPSTYQHWAHEAIATVNRCFPPVELLTTWSQCQRLLPHALACAALIEKEQVISEAAGRLLHRIGAYLLEWAQYAQAASYLTRASLILRQVLGEHHPIVMESLNHQAELAYFQGHYLQAEHLHRHVLHLREQQLGPEHVETATSLHNLAAACWILGKYQQAEPLYRRALHIREQRLGCDHLDTGETSLNLAALLLDQERYNEAESLLERSFLIFQQVLDPHHLYLMPVCNELGRLRHAQGRYAQAKEFHQQAKTLGEQAHATRHPFYAITLTHLGRLAGSEGAWSLAEAWYRQALGIWEEVQGSQKPQAQILHHLAVLSQQLGRADQALDLYQQALTLGEKVLPPAHPDTADTLHDLAHFQHVQQHDEEARALYRQALAIRDQVFGPSHPKTEATRAAYAQLLREMGREEEVAAVDVQGVQEQESTP